ncbi:hypothetical protein HHK36_011205 [Tetracentron sinense]|uniref:HMA domain-containing protein n=1 Tax=Tetracentron sinense TaxID=13715 RepID=A0A835DH42_TETSI|nr:hypothetical protein HHK36_011205 [Tetracentron sinense]
MGEKDSKNEGKKKNGDGGKKEDGPITVVLKIDMHCEGCAKKVKRHVYDYKGVESVKSDSNTNKLTVVGKVDPANLRETIEEKTKKKVELISPLPKKDKDGGGVQTVTADLQKDLVTVKGTMDVKALVGYLKEKLNKSVEIVPAKKVDGGGGNKKEKADKKDGDGKVAGDGGKSEEAGKMEGNKMEFHGYGPGYGYGPEPGYGPGYGYGPVHGPGPVNGYGPGPVNGYGQGYVVGYPHAPQMFSDENPNACSIITEEMGEKDSKNEGKKKNGDGGKKEDGPITVVLKIDMHCEGCAKKVKRHVYDYKGVESVKSDSNTNKLTVVGKVDPANLRETIEEKTKKKVELISPLPKKDKDGGGVQTVTADLQKDLVTVKGTMDVKALVGYLKEKLNKSVEIVPAKKVDGGGGNKKEKADKKDGDGKVAGDGGKSEEAGKMEGNKMEFHGYGPGPGYGPEPGYGPGYGYGPVHGPGPVNGYGPGPVNGYGQGYVVGYPHAPQMFSDENPNACSIM